MEEGAQMRRKEAEEKKLAEAPQPDPKQPPPAAANGNEQYYVYETRRGVKAERGVVDKGVILPYFGITKDAIIGGRYHSGSVEGSNFIQIIGVMDYYTAKGVETSLIEINSRGFPSVSTSTRVDNLIRSTVDMIRQRSGAVWLNVHYPGWQKTFLRPANPKSSP